MAVISVPSSIQGNSYTVRIAGDTPTPEEQARIEAYVAQMDQRLSARAAPPAAAPEEPSAVGDFFSGVGRGFGGTLASIPSGLGALAEMGYGAMTDQDITLGSTGVGRVANDISDFARGGVEGMFGPSTDTTSGKIGEAIGSVGSFLLPAGLVGGGARLLGAGARAAGAAGTAASTVTGAAVGADQQAQEIGDAILNGDIVSPEAQQAAVLWGGVIGTSEMVAGGAASKLVGTTFKILNKVPPSMKEEAIATIGGVVRSALKTGGIEGAQEALAQIAQNVVSREYYDEGRDIYEGAGEQFGLGGAAGAAIDLLITGARAPAVRRSLQQKQAEEDRRIDDEITSDLREMGAGIEDKINRGLERGAYAPPKEYPIGLPAPTIGSGMPAGPSFRWQQYQSVVQSLDPKKAVTIPAIQVAAAKSGRKITPAQALDIRSQLVSDGYIAPSARAKDKYTANPAAQPALDRAESYRRTLQDLSKDLEEAELLRQQKEQELRAAQQTGKPADAQKMMGDLARAEKRAEEIRSTMEEVQARLPMAQREEAVQTKETPAGPDAQGRTVAPLDQQAPETQAVVAESRANRLRQALAYYTERAQKEQSQIAKLQGQGKKVQLPKSEQARLDALKKSLEQSKIAARKLTEKLASPAVAAQDTVAEAKAARVSPDYAARRPAVVQALKQRLANLGLADVNLTAERIVAPEMAEQGAFVEGMFDVNGDGKAAISVSMGVFDEKMSDTDMIDALSGVIDHEAIHALRNLGLFTNAEWKLLSDLAARQRYRMVKNGKVVERSYTYLQRAKRMYPDASLEVQVEEAVAEMYRDYEAGRLKIGGKPKTLMDRIRNFFRSLRAAHKDVGFTDAAQVFEGIRSGKVGGRDRVGAPEALDAGRQSRIQSVALPDGVAAEEEVRDPKDIVMPIDPNASVDEIKAQIKAMTDENVPIIRRLLAEIDAEFGTKSNDSVKDPDKVIQKATRPSILYRKPWHTVAHIRDTYRFQTQIDDFRQAPAIFQKLLDAGVTIVKIDTNKLFNPTEWGWRIIAFDLRMPNGQLVEYQLPLKEMLRQKKAVGHDIYEEWRGKTQAELIAQQDEYLSAIARSYEGYNEAFFGAMERLGMTPQEAEAAWMSAESSLLDAARNSRRSSGVMTSSSVSNRGFQTPSSVRMEREPSSLNRMALGEPSSTSANVLGMGGTSGESVSQGSVEDNLTPTQRDQVRYSIAMVRDRPIKGLGQPINAPVRSGDGRTTLHYGTIIDGGRPLPVLLNEGSHNEDARAGIGMAHIKARGHDRELFENSRYQSVEQAIYDLMYRWSRQGHKNGEDVIAYPYDGNLTLEWVGNLTRRSPPLRLVLSHHNADGFRFYTVKTFFPVLPNGKAKDRRYSLLRLPSEIPVNEDAYDQNAFADWESAREQDADDQGAGRAIGVPASTAVAPRTPFGGTNVGGLTVADLDRITPDFFQKEGWAILTATHKTRTDAQNEQAHERLKAILAEREIPYREVYGVYEGQPDGVSYIILADEPTAAALGNQFRQDSILTNRGLVYTMDVALPRTIRNDGIFYNDDARRRDYYSQFDNGTAFSLDLDWGSGPTAADIGIGFYTIPSRPQLPIRASDNKVELHHWSRRKLTNVDPAKAGTGPLAGVERQRDAKLGFFGINPREDVRQQGTGYVKEAGLGDREYIALVDPDDLYPWFTDPDNLFVGLDRRDPDWQTAYEERIKEAGYKGYYVERISGTTPLGEIGPDDAVLGNVAAMFYKTKVKPVETVQLGLRNPPRYSMLMVDGVYDKDRMALVEREAKRRTISRMGPSGDTPDRISQRTPKTKRAVEDPLRENLIIDLKAMQASPAAFAANMDLLKTYIGFNTEETEPDKVAEDFVRFVEENLIWLHNQVPAQIRKQSKRWYDGARRITENWSGQYGVPDYGVAGVLAALSPQKDWYQNVSLAERVLDIHTTFTRGNMVGFTPTEDMARTARRIYKGADYADALRNVLTNSYADLRTEVEQAMWLRIYDETYNPRGYRTVSAEGDFVGKAYGKVAWGSNVEIAKAIYTLKAQSREATSEAMGENHKVRNFFNNILAPNAPHGDVTMDTHAVAAALIRPLSGSSAEVHHNFGSSPEKRKQPADWRAAKNVGDSGAKGTYGIYAEAYRRAAARLGILPRELQSITWEAVRGLFPAVEKRNKALKERVENEWRRVSEGKATAAEARERILQIMGGVNEPTWYGHDYSAAGSTAPTSYEGELAGSRLDRQYRDAVERTDAGDAGGTRGTAGGSGTALRDVYAGRPRTAKRGPRSRFSVRYSASAITPQVQRKVQTNQKALMYARSSDLIAKALNLKGYGLEINKAREISDGILRRFQDSMLPVGRMVQDLSNAGLTITDAMDPYLQEELMHGVVGQKIGENQRGLFEPMLADVQKIKVDKARIDQLVRLSDAASAKGRGFVGLALEQMGSPRLALAEAFLYARHAKERNRYIKANRDQTNDAGSGMTDAEADAILNWFSRLDPVNQSIFARIGKNAALIVANTNQTRLDGGLISDEVVDAEEGATVQGANFRNYVPLRGKILEDAEDDFAGPPSSPRFGARGREDRKALGRFDYPTDIIANLLTQNQNAILRAERNKVGLALLRLLRSDPAMTSEYAEVLPKQPTIRDSRNGKVTDVSDPRAYQDPDILVVKENGKEVFIRFTDERMAGAMNGRNGMSPANANILIRAMQQVNRFLSSINTSYNPEFFITNMFRDLQTAGVNVNQYELDGITKEVMGGLKGALVGIKRVIRNEDDTSEWSKVYKDFMAAGGQNATNQFNSLAEEMANIQTLLGDISEAGARGQWAKVRNSFAGKGARSLLQFVEDYNTVVENGVRVAAYKALLDRGFSKQRAAQAARNLTVNFAKGGDYRLFMNAWSLFYNASLQGTFALLNAAVRSSRVRKMWMGVAVIGLLQDQLNALLSDEDDDGEKVYDKIPDYVLERNFILPDPFGITDRSYISIPMPYGLNMAHNLGRSVSRAMRGGYSAGEAAQGILLNVMDTINPLGGTESFANFVAPTIADPFIDIIENEDFADKPIYKEGLPFDRTPPPDSQQYWGTTSPSAIWVANALNDLTGGNEVRAGLIDWSPDIMEFWFSFATGGVGRFVQSIVEAPATLLQEGFSEELVRSIPFVRKTIGSVSSREDMGEYIEGAARVMTAAEELKRAREVGDAEWARDTMQRYGAELRLVGPIKSMEGQLRKISRMRNQIEDNPNIPESQKSLLLKRLDERKQMVLSRANTLLKGLEE